MLILSWRFGLHIDRSSFCPIAVDISDGTQWRGTELTCTCSGILPVNAHVEVNILNLNYIYSFIFSSNNRFSNDIHYN